jgi:hypothetical protein
VRGQPGSAPGGGFPPLGAVSLNQAMKRATSRRTALEGGASKRTLSFLIGPETTYIGFAWVLYPPITRMKAPTNPPERSRNCRPKGSKALQRSQIPARASLPNSKA